MKVFRLKTMFLFLIPMSLCGLFVQRFYLDEVETKEKDKPKETSYDSDMQMILNQENGLLLENINLREISVEDLSARWIWDELNPTELTNKQVDLIMLRQRARNEGRIKDSFPLDPTHVRALESLKYLPPITKVVHIAWKQKKGLVDSQSATILNGLRNIIDMNPDWKVEISDDDDVEEYIKSKLDKEDYELIKTRHIVEKVDLWRLLKIYHEGGFYIDVDRHYNIPLAKFIKKNTKCVLPITSFYNFAQSIMLCAAGSPFHKEAIRLNLKKRRHGERNILHMGPDAYLEAIMNVLYDTDTSKNFYPFPSFGSWDLTNYLLHLFKSSEYVESFNEFPPHYQIVYEYDPKTWKGPHGDKNNFYKKSGVKHWQKNLRFKRN